MHPQLGAFVVGQAFRLHRQRRTVTVLFDPDPDPDPELDDPDDDPNNDVPSNSNYIVVNI